MLDPGSSAGCRTPGKTDIEEAGNMLGIDFYLNVVLNEKKRSSMLSRASIEAIGKVLHFDNISRSGSTCGYYSSFSRRWPKDIDIFRPIKPSNMQRSSKKGGS